MVTAAPGRTGRGPRVAIETQGCKLNLADSELLAQDFAAAGFAVVPAGQPTDVYILNTCTVTHVADGKARQKLRAARRRFPGALVVATGCYPARDRADLEAMDEVDLVMDNAEKPAIADAVAQRLLSAPLTVLQAADLPPRAPFPSHHTRAFIKIQEGCNDHCAYCIIPKTRGASRFFDANAIVAAVSQRVAAGYREVVLTGTQLGDYGIAQPGSRRDDADLRDQGSEGDPLAALLRRVLAETGVQRLRVSSLQPQDMTPRLLDAWADARLCRHFHLPLQAGAGPVLRAMRRRYTQAEFLASVDRIRTAYPDASITSDLIVGFPGERDEDFAASLDVCRAARFAGVHVFPYSPRPHTLAERAAADPALAVPDGRKQQRLQAAMDVATGLQTAHLARFVGDCRPVLWEGAQRDGDGAPRWSGLTDNYLRVTVVSDRLQGGDIAMTRLVATDGTTLTGELAG